jgi:hypothetical protein
LTRRLTVLRAFAIALPITLMAYFSAMFALCVLLRLSAITASTATGMFMDATLSDTTATLSHLLIATIVSAVIAVGISASREFAARSRSPASYPPTGELGLQNLTG